MLVHWLCFRNVSALGEVAFSYNSVHFTQDYCMEYTYLQALIMGTLVAMGATARFTGPLWGKKLSSVGVYNNVNVCCSPANAAYLAADHHVYIVMNILSVSILLVMVPFILLYRTMKPATQLVRTSDEITAEIHQDTAEHVSSGDNGKKELVSGVEKESGGRVKRRRNVESDKIKLISESSSSASSDEEEVIIHSHYQFF